MQEVSRLFRSVLQEAVEKIKEEEDAKKLAKVSVKAEVVKPAKGPKITIMKYKNKTGYKKRQGHRQPLTQVKITAIDA